MEAQKPSGCFARNHPYAPLRLLAPLKPELKEARLGPGWRAGGHSGASEAEAGVAPLVTDR